RKRHALLPGLEEGQRSCRTAHLRPGRTRLRLAPHQSPSNGVAATRRDLVRNYPRHSGADPMTPMLTDAVRNAGQASGLKSFLVRPLRLRKQTSINPNSLPADE